jgi:hypothetical protein
MNTKQVDGIFIPYNMTHINFTLGFMALAIIGEPLAKQGFYGQLETWINARIPLDIFANCKDMMQWVLVNKERMPKEVAKSKIAEAWPLACAIVEKVVKEATPTEQLTEPPPTEKPTQFRKK